MQFLFIIDEAIVEVKSELPWSEIKQTLLQKKLDEGVKTYLFNSKAQVLSLVNKCKVPIDVLQFYTKAGIEFIFKNIEVLVQFSQRDVNELIKTLTKYSEGTETLKSFSKAEIQSFIEFLCT